MEESKTGKPSRSDHYQNSIPELRCSCDCYMPCDLSSDGIFMAVWYG